MTSTYQDPHLPWIWGFFSSGVLLTGLSLPGYLNQMEGVAIGSVAIQYPAAARKLPLSILGSGLVFMSWWEVKNREEWLEQHDRNRVYALTDEQHNRAFTLQLRQAEQEAELEFHRAKVQLQQAERFYGEMGEYMEPQQPMRHAAVDIEYQTEEDLEVGRRRSQQPTATLPPEPEAATGNPSAYLENFIEYPGLLFGGQGSGKSWTTRMIAAQKVAAGHRVVVLDPHSPKREWQGVEQIGAGMDYAAIDQFLQWYMGELVRRYQDMNSSGLTEEEWQDHQRQQGNVISVICEEMTNWAERCTMSGTFFKAAMSDSRKVLMPPLFVAHDRTLSCLGDAKGVARLRDASLLELELVPKVHPVTRKPVASGKGSFKLPGHSEWIEVEIPKVERKITDFRPYAIRATNPPVAPPIAPPLQQPITQPAPQQHPPTATPPEPQQPTDPVADFRKNITSLLQEIETEERLDQLPDRYRPLIEYSNRNGWVKAADIQRNVRAYDGMSTADLRRLFKQMAADGVGKVRGEGDRLQFNADLNAPE